MFIYVCTQVTHTHTHKEIWPIINEALNEETYSTALWGEKVSYTKERPG